MQLNHVLLVLSFIGSCGTLATKSNPVFSSVATVNNPRLLRETKLTYNEERMVDTFLKSMRTSFWLETGKSDEYVKKTLELDNLSEAALKSAPNYQYYEHFLFTREGRMLDEWLLKGIPTREVWTRYNLEGVLVAQLKDNDGFKTYLRYATMEDDKIFKLKSQDKDVTIDYSATPGELNAKVDMWVSLERPSWYVKKMLNLDRRSYDAFRKSANYKLYEKYEYGIEGRKLEKWLLAGIPPKLIWDTYKLDELSPANFRAYQMYIRYGIMHDDEVFKLWKSGKEIKPELGGTSEMEVKVKIWASLKRPDQYVEELLNLDRNALKTSPNYEFYQKFLRGTAATE
ncbi:Secreted RxLR effector peptide protein [Phytophthora palmivora]|uniref:Secreted RxLR effector peptide protein n=1 Tax=Phytophthora palmivora TaxID=4796 RepID=A0A2P4XUF0_9STRA|nr:Secreted RxLR effector peptide protein [Phytophthora palmivora]